MRNDDENNPRWPSWSEADDVGRFFYVMAAIWAFLIISSFFND